MGHTVFQGKNLLYPLCLTEQLNCSFLLNPELYLCGLIQHWYTEAELSMLLLLASTSEDFKQTAKGTEFGKRTWKTNLVLTTKPQPLPASFHPCDPQEVDGANSQLPKAREGKSSPAS